MKNRSSISILISAVIIFAGLYFLSKTIENRPTSGISQIPSSFEVQTGQARDYMNEWKAINYLCLDDGVFYALLQSGELDGTYASYKGEKTIEGGRSSVYIFSKTKLDEWMAKKIEAKESIN